jgi:hypothetical protein
MRDTGKMNVLATRCGSCGCGCPTILETEKDELIVVGKLDANTSENTTIRQYTGDGEMAVVIPKTLLIEAAKALASE